MAETFPLKLVFVRASREVKMLLKRVVSKATDQKFSSQMPFHFAKVCQINPLVAIDKMIAGIEYGFNTNLIQPYIDCTTRLPDICHDIGAFLLTKTIFKSDKPLLDTEKAVLSSWFDNVTEFTSLFFKCHSIEIYGLLKVLVLKIQESAQEKQQLSSFLIRVLLVRLVEHMTGRVTIQDMTRDQVSALAGGPLLWRVTVDSAFDVEDLRKSKRRLLEGFQHDENLAKMLLGALSQQCSILTNSQELTTIVTEAGGLKFVSNLFDGARSCLFTLVDCLQDVCSQSVYRSFLPQPSKIFEMFDPAMAFSILRKSMIPTDPFPYYPPNWKKSNLGKIFYCTFWSLSLSDIHHPQDAYAKALETVTNTIAKQEEAIVRLSMRVERDSQLARDLKTMNRDQDKMADRRDKLKKEDEDQKVALQKTLARLQNEHKQWFQQATPHATKCFVTEMLAPRLLTSNSDALFCVHFMKAMIKMKTPGFQLLDFYNSWTTLLTQFMRCSTENEAEIFGLFLREMMQYILHLRQNEKLFEEEIKDNPCFHRNYYTPRQSQGDIVFASLADVKKGHGKWETRIMKALKPGLESADWMEKSTALKVLSKTWMAFPMLEKNGKVVLDMVKNIAENETRKDVKTFAGSLVFRLKNQAEKWFRDTDREKKKEDKTDKRKDEKRKRVGDNLDDEKPSKVAKEDGKKEEDEEKKKDDEEKPNKSEDDLKKTTSDPTKGTERKKSDGDLKTPEEETKEMEKKKSEDDKKKSDEGSEKKKSDEDKKKTIPDKTSSKA